MTPAQQTALTAELKNDPLARGYAALLRPYNESGLVTLLNALSYTLVGVVPISTFAGWCAQTGLRAVIEDTANKATSAYYLTALRSPALAILDILHGAAGSLDLSASAQGQANIGMLGAWVTAGAITTAQEAQLVSLATAPASRVQVLGIGPVSREDVTGTVFNAVGTKVI